MYANERDSLIQFRQSVASEPHLPLENYINSSLCEALEWITLLRITSPRLTQVEVVNLAGLKNLASLDILATSRTPCREAVQDSVIRSWSRNVKDCGAFSRLLTLGLRGWEGVTVKSIAHLSNFPALVFFDVSNTSITEADFDLSGLRGWNCQPIPESPSPLNPAKSSHTFLWRFREASRTLAHRHGFPFDPDRLPVHFVSVGLGGPILDHGARNALFFQRTEEIIEDSVSSWPKREEEEQVGFKRKQARQKEARKQVRLSKRQSVDKILGEFCQSLTP